MFHRLFFTCQGACIIGILFPFIVTAQPDTRPDSIRTVTAPTIDKQISVVNLPIQIRLATVEKAVNEQVKGLVYEDNSFEDNGGDNLKIKAWKKENIRINVSGKTLKYYVPIKLWIQIRYGAFGVYDTKDVEGAIAMYFETDYDIAKDWQMTTKTDLVEYKWLETPVLDLGVTKVSIKAIADQLIKQNKALLTTTIDQEIKKNMDLRTYAADAWQSAQVPMLLDSAYQAWLKLTPQDVMMTPLVTEKGIIKTTVGIRALSEVVIGKRPAAAPASKLPPFKEVANIPDLFLVNLTADIPYSEAERLAKTQLVGQVFGEGKKTVKVEDLGLFASGDGWMYVELLLSGKFNGAIYAKGKPVYNSDSLAIVMTEFDYDIKTKNALFTSANWVLKSAILKRLQPYLSYSLANDLAAMRIMIAESLDNMQPVEGVTLNGSLSDMTVQQIFLTPERIKALIVAKGKLGLTVAD